MLVFETLNNKKSDFLNSNTCSYLRLNGTYTFFQRKEGVSLIQSTTANQAGVSCAWRSRRMAVLKVPYMLLMCIVR